eukprot:5151142-Pyramimonas_sp.AAC.1
MLTGFPGVLTGFPGTFAGAQAKAQALEAHCMELHFTAERSRNAASDVRALLLPPLTVPGNPVDVYQGSCESVRSPRELARPSPER